MPSYRDHFLESLESLLAAAAPWVDMQNAFQQLADDCLHESAEPVSRALFPAVRERLRERADLGAWFAREAGRPDDRGIGDRLWVAANWKLAALWAAVTLKAASTRSMDVADEADLRTAWDWFAGAGSLRGSWLPPFPVGNPWKHFDLLIDPLSSCDIGPAVFWRWVTHFDGRGWQARPPAAEASVQCPCLAPSASLASVNVRFWPAAGRSLQPSPHFAMVPVGTETLDTIEAIYREFAAGPGNGLIEWEIDLEHAGVRGNPEGVSLGGAAAVAFASLACPESPGCRNDTVVMAQLPGRNGYSLWRGLDTELQCVALEQRKLPAISGKLRLVVPIGSSVRNSDLPPSVEIVRVSTVGDALAQVLPNPVLVGHLQSLIAEFSFAPKDFSGQKYRRVRLDKVFVSLFGYPGGNRELGTRAHLRTAFGASLDPLVFQRRRMRRVFAPAVHTAENLETVLDRHPCALILGDPGSGKTTLLYQVAARLAEACSRNSSNRVPIFIRAADLATFSETKARLTGRAGTLAEFIGRQALGSAPLYPAGQRQGALEPIDEDTMHSLLLAHLSRYGGIILIDGLDEGGDQDRRRKVAALIDTFLGQLITESVLREVNIRVLITSRIVGYEQAPLATKVARYVIEPLQDSAIRKLAANWFAANCETEEEGLREAESFLSQLLDPASERLRSIAENPYLLTLLSATYQEHGGMPASRADLYRSVVDNNILRWFVGRNLPGSDRAVALVIKVAFHLHSESPNGRIGGQTLINLLEELIEQEDTQTLDAESFAQLITVHSGLMVERGNGEFAFAHRSLQEYLAGRCLLMAGMPGKEIVTHSLNARWREPVLLSLGYANLIYKPARFGKLLEQVLDQDDSAGVLLPAGAMLLADAYFEIPVFPAPSRRKILRRLFSHYCSHSFPGNIPHFRRFVEQFFAALWGRAPLDSNEEIDAEDVLADALSGSDRESAVAAANLIHERRIYSDRLANALVEAQRHDSPENEWAIHSTLQVLVSRPEIEKRFEFARVPDDFGGFDSLADKLPMIRQLTRDLRFVPAPPEISKMRRKLTGLRVDCLRLRRVLLDNPALAASITGDPARLADIARLGIGGFADFETAQMARVESVLRIYLALGVGPSVDRRRWAILLDSSLNPTLAVASQSPVEFRAEWLIRDPENVDRWISHLRHNGQESGGEHSARSPLAARAILHDDALRRVEVGGRSLAPSADPVAEARAWSKRLFLPQDDRAYSLAVLLDTTGEMLAADPRRLLLSVGLCRLSRPALSVMARQVVWTPRRLDDFLFFALDVLDSLPSQLGFLHTWFLMQIGPLFIAGAPLHHSLAETLARLVRLRSTDPLLDDALSSAPSDLRGLPLPRFIEALVPMAEAIEDPYLQARALITIASGWPARHAALADRAFDLAARITDPMDRAIIFSLLAASRARTHRTRDTLSLAVDVIVGMDESADLFRASIAGRDLARFADRFFPPADREEPGHAVTALLQVRSEHWAAGGDELSNSSKVWSAIRSDHTAGWSAVLRHARNEWLELTPSGLEVFRSLPAVVQSRLTPYLFTPDEALLAVCADSGDVCRHISLLAAENGRWSATGMRDIAELLDSPVDIYRARAQDVLETTRRDLAFSQVGEAAYFAAIRLFRESPNRTAIFWFLTDLRQDDPEAVAAWCDRAEESDEHWFALNYCRSLSEPVWRVLISRLEGAPPSTLNAILNALRTVVEEGIRAPMNPADLRGSLERLLCPDCDEVIGAKALDILGFLPPEESAIFAAERYASRPLMQSAAMVSAGRLSLIAFLPIAGSLPPELRLAQLTGCALLGALFDVDADACDLVRALIARCRGTRWNAVYRAAVAQAADFVASHWEDGDGAPLDELLALTARYLDEECSRSGDLRPKPVFDVLDLRDAVAVAASVSELMPVGFAEAVAPSAERWLPRLVRLARKDPSFVVRGAALRLLGALPQTTEETLVALSSGLFDVALVSEVAESLCDQLPPPTQLALRVLEKKLDGLSLTGIAAASRILASACETIPDEILRSTTHECLVSSLNRLLQDERTEEPLVRLSSTNGRGYEFRRDQTLGAELGGILFRLQAITLSPEMAQIPPRFQVNRTVFTAPLVNDTAAADRIEFGDLTISDRSIHQYDLCELPSEVRSVLDSMIGLCRRENYAVEEFARAIARWAAETPEATQ